LEIIAVYNIKGGVGKTTTAVNLAYLSAATGWPTLLWDLDPQGAATFLLQGGPQRKAGARRIIEGKRLLEELVAPTNYNNLDLLPADFSYRHMDLHLNERKKRAARLLKLMRPLQINYGSVFLDCPPGISLVSENIMRAADALLIPTIPSPLSIRMLEQLQEFLIAHRRPDLVLLPFFSMVDRRRSLHQEAVAAIRERFSMMLRTEIPYLSDIERVSVRRAPLPAYAPQNPGSLAYASLWQEIDSRLDSARAAPGKTA
jgi:cellulose biosynthesis protein BcsQ